MDVQERLESGLEAWGHRLNRRPWMAIVPMLLCTAFFASWLPRMEIEVSDEATLHPDDPEVLRYFAFRREFGREDRIVVALQPPDIFALDFLERLRKLHHELEEEVPFVDGVTSLVNVRSTRGEQGALVVEPLLEDWPEDEGDLRALKERVEANPFYRNTIVSDDLKLTTIILEPQTYSSSEAGGELAGFGESEDSDAAPPHFLDHAEAAELIAALERVLARYEAPDLRILVAGPLILNNHFHAMIGRDTRLFAGLALAAIVTLLALLFRRLSGVALPLVVVGLSLFTSLGIMVATGVPLSISVELLPAFLLTVGVCDSVHLLVIVYQRLAAGSEKGDAIAFSLRHSGLPVVMTSLTTAAGMLSFLPASLAPVSDLGIMAAVGVMLALAYTLVLLPALMAVLPIERERGPWTGSLGEQLSRPLVAVGLAATAHPWRVLAGASLVGIGCAAGIAQLRFSHDWVRFLPPEDPVRTAIEELDRAMKGALTFEVLAETRTDDGLYDPDTLRRVESAVQAAATTRQGPLVVGKALSVVDIVKETHQALNENRPSAYTLPDSRAEIAQELLLFETSGSDDLVQFVDPRYATARISLRVPNASSTLFPGYLNQVEARIREALGDGIDVVITGMLPLSAKIFTGLITSMARSYAIAFLLITPLMVLVLASFRRGLLAMIPNLIPIVFILGVMGWLGIDLDASTILVGAVVLGLAVDDTIHFMYKFERHLSETGSVPDAVRETLATTGSAMLFTSLVLFSGFVVFTFSYTQNTAAFGALAATATLVAFVADVVVAPALVALDSRRRVRVAARALVGS